MPNKIELRDATVALTGATRGIGKALCSLLIAEGATVVAIARDEDRLSLLRDEFGERLVPFACDLSEPHSRDETIDAVTEQFESISGLINNAAVQTEMSHFADDMRGVVVQSGKEIETNFTAPVHLFTRLAPLMSAQSTPFVVNITSGLAIAPKEAAPVYSATKAGLRSFTRALRYQAQSSRPELCVIEAIMALVDSDMTRGRGKGKITAERAATEILRGIMDGKQEIWVAKAKLLPWLEKLSPKIPARILR